MLTISANLPQPQQTSIKLKLKPAYKIELVISQCRFWLILIKAALKDFLS